jgi:transcriptional regulator with XRE-family HTH domain
MAAMVLELPFLLSGALARYLRRFLGLTQAELATKLNVNRVTVAKWESGEADISPHHDMALRALVVAAMSGHPDQERFVPAARRAAILGHVRTQPPTELSPLVISDYLDRASPLGRAAEKARARLPS